MASDVGKQIGGLRQLVEDLVAPSVGRVEERLYGIQGLFTRLSKQVENLGEDWKQLLTRIHETEMDLQRLEDRVQVMSDGLGDKIRATVLDIAREQYRPSHDPPSFPPTS